MSHQICSFPDQCGFLNQCLEQNGAMICVHNPIFPLTPYTGLIYGITPIILGIGMLGGLGGGVLKGPILEMLLDYDQIQATAISYCLMFGGCCLYILFVVFEKNPKDKKRPIINYDLGVIFNCSLTLACSVGSALNVFLPQFYVNVIQQVFLLCVLPYLWRKGVKARQSDLNSKVQDTEPQRINDSLLGDTTFLEDKELLETLQTSEQRTFPPLKILIVFVFFFTTQIFINGLSRIQMKLPHCLRPQQLMLICLCFLNIPMTYLVYKYGQNLREQRKQVNYLLDEDYFEKKKFIFIYIAGWLSGLVSGLIGLGSGLIMVPAMLYLNVLPRVSSSTSAFNYFWMGLTNLISLLVNNLLPWKDAAVFLGLAAFGGSVITQIGTFIIKKYKISYIVIFFVFFLGIYNIVAGVWYVTTETKRFGFKALLESRFTCE